jgi:hypothetical protein
LIWQSSERLQAEDICRPSANQTAGDRIVLPGWTCGSCDICDFSPEIKAPTGRGQGDAVMVPLFLNWSLGNWISDVALRRFEVLLTEDEVKEMREIVVSIE